MIAAELFKLRNQRTPWVLTAVATLAMTAPVVYFLFRQPGDAATYASAVTNVFSIMAMMVGAIIGGWLLGHEYSQSTLRRVALLEARRSTLLAIKLVAGLIVLIGSYVASVAAALGMAWLVASLHGDTMVMTGIYSSFVSGALVGMASAIMAFGISAITRSSAYSTLTVLAAMLIFSPLLSLVPKVGVYSPGLVIQQTADKLARVSNEVGAAFGGQGLSDTRAILATLAWVGGTLLVGQQVFKRQDI